jgi:hypothetical protein
LNKLLIAEQITKNLSIVDHLSFMRNFTNLKFTENPMVQALLKRLRINPIKQQTLSSNLIDPIQIDLIQLTIDEQRLLRTIHNISSTENIEFSYNLQLNNSSKTKLQS